MYICYSRSFRPLYLGYLMTPPYTCFLLRSSSYGGQEVEGERTRIMRMVLILGAW